MSGFVYSPLDDVQNLYDAGFRVGRGIIVALAVTCAESHNDPDAKNVAGNTPPSTDRGMRQINSYWHPEVTDACAYDVKCSAREMFRISKQGTDFTPWAAFNSGSYKTYMDWAWVAVDAWTRTATAKAQADADKAAAVQQIVQQSGATIAAREATIADLQRQLTQMTGADKDLLARLDAATAAVQAATAERDTAAGRYDALVQRVRGYANDIATSIIGS